MSDAEFMDLEEAKEPIIPFKEWIFGEQLRLGRASYILLSSPSFVALWLIIGGFESISRLIKTLIWFPSVVLYALYSSGGYYQVLFVALPLMVWMLLSAKRLHDTGSPGTTLVICCIPFIGLPLLLAFLFLMKGDSNRNKYGYPERLRKYLPSDDEENEKFINSLEQEGVQ